MMSRRIRGGNEAIKKDEGGIKKQSKSEAFRALQDSDEDGDELVALLVWKSMACGEPVAI